MAREAAFFAACCILLQQAHHGHLAAQPNSASCCYAPAGECSLCSPGHSRPLPGPPEQPLCPGSRSLQGQIVAKAKSCELCCHLCPPTRVGRRRGRVAAAAQPQQQEASVAALQQRSSCRPSLCSTAACSTSNESGARCRGVLSACIHKTHRTPCNLQHTATHRQPGAEACCLHCPSHPRGTPPPRGAPARASDQTPRHSAVLWIHPWCGRSPRSARDSKKQD